MELNELRRKTKKGFDKNDVDIVEMLITWIETESNARINRLLSGSGIDVEQIHALLKDLHSSGVCIPQNLLTKAVCSKSGRNFLDIDMIQFLLLEKSNLLTIHLIEKGVDIEVIISNIENERTKIPEIEIHNSHFFSHPAGINMTQNALSGAYRGLIKREDIILRIEDVLLRKNKANVIITGPSGIGKTAIVELMARESALDEQNRMHHIQFFEVNLDDLFSGTGIRGELERKLSELISQAEKAKPILFFIDEIHRINPSQEGRNASGQLAEMLIPYIDRDEIKVIGTTTTEEYQRFIVKNSALCRRFQQISIDEPKGKELIKMVKGYVEVLQHHHAIKISDEIISATITLTDQYIKNRYQPDKTIEVLDTACVAAGRLGEKSITLEEVIRTIASAIKIPVEIIGRRKDVTSGVISRLKSTIIGQDEAIDTVVSTLAIKMSGFRRVDSPLAVFMFAGNSGVGKTELAKKIALELLGDENRLTMVDMAEFSSNFTISKLIGSPPGYIDSDKEGIIPAAISENSYCVIVFDEIEKASGEVHRLLLGLMDTGRITSGTGRVYDASNVIIIMTTNAISSESIRKSRIGFVQPTDCGDKIMTQLQTVFPVEFLGRIDDVVMFNSLTDKDYEKIISIHIDVLLSDLANNGYQVSCDKTALIRYVMEHMKYREIGVRGVLQALRNNLLKPIVILSGQSEENENIDIEKLLTNNE